MSELENSAKELYDTLRLRTLPISIKLFEKEEDLNAIEKIKRLPYRTTFCQLVTLSRTLGWTIGVSNKNLAGPACMFLFGFAPLPKEGLLDGKIYTGVWCKTQEDAAKFQQSVPRVAFGKYNAAVLSPVASGHLESPDMVLVYGNPAQMNLIMNAIQWEDYERLNLFFSGEGSCADSMVECLTKKKPSATVPCLGQRRFGHVMDDEMEIAIPPDHLGKVLEGLKSLKRIGVRYPIPIYGPQVDTLDALAGPYPAIKEYVKAASEGKFYEKF